MSGTEPSESQTTVIADCSNCGAPIDSDLQRAIADERERIASAIDAEADICPCAEDAMVLRETALLVRANFSYEDAEALERADAK